MWSDVCTSNQQQLYVDVSKDEKGQKDINQGPSERVRSGQSRGFAKGIKEENRALLGTGASVVPCGAVVGE